MTSGKPCIQRKKLVVVGDGDTGKTSIVFVFTKSKYPEVYVPTVLETEVVEVRHYHVLINIFNSFIFYVDKTECRFTVGCMPKEGFAEAWPTKPYKPLAIGM